MISKQAPTQVMQSEWQKKSLLGAGLMTKTAKNTKTHNVLAARLEFSPVDIVINSDNF